MMTEAQEDQITDYLIFQKLPVDILLEVKDHMISQVLDIQLNQNLSFDDAFVKTKRLWENEFKMVSYLFFYPVKIPLIAKKIIKERYNNLLKKSLFIGLLFFGINLLLVYSSKTQEDYEIFFRLLNGTLLLALGIAWILNIKIWKYLKADFKYNGKCFYTMYQKNMGLMGGSTIAMLQIVGKNGHYAYDFFKTQNTTEPIGLLVTLVVPLILQIAVVFTLFNFFEHKKALKRIQNFLASASTGL
jgi:hypothetical protein